MRALFVVEAKDRLNGDIPGAEIAAADEYLTDHRYENGDYDRVVNLCPCERKGQGYYVSLLAEARGHEPLPGVKSIEDLQSKSLIRTITRELDDVIQSTLREHSGDSIELDIFFGRDRTGRSAALSQQLFSLLKAPLLRARFKRSRHAWHLADLRVLDISEVPADQHSDLIEAGREYISGQSRVRPGPPAEPFAVAILHDGNEPDAPSNRAALDNFIHAAQQLGMRAEIINRRAIGKLETFDALFIRDTTNPGHYTYEFSSRAAALGLVVIDDPESILLCNNKVFLQELLARHQIPLPKTLMVHQDNINEIVPTLRLPCILKKPDSAFSLGVKKFETEDAVAKAARDLLRDSKLIIAQEFVPTEFDWRVGVLDGRAIFVCRYHMAPGHWQVIKRERGERTEGQTVAMSVGEAPEKVVKTAVAAANLIGAGFYGVDLKTAGDQCVVMEINDNPNVDAGNEDGVLGSALYREIMGVIKRRIQEPARARETR